MRTEQKYWESYFEKEIKIFPPRIQKDLKTLKQPEINHTGNLFVYGEVETGKTIYASFFVVKTLLKAFLENRKLEVCFISFPDLFYQLKAEFNAKEKTVMDKYMNCDLLFLDDFLSVTATDWVMDILYHLINYRYEQLLQTVITSNLSLPKLEQKLNDQRICSRINRSYNIVEKSKNWK